MLEYTQTRGTGTPHVFLHCCFPANRDPVVQILGPSFATVEGEDSAVLRLQEKVRGGDPGGEAEIQVKLLMLLQQLDTQLLSSSLKQISQYVRWGSIAP